MEQLRIILVNQENIVFISTGKSQLVLLTGIIKDSSATSTNYQNYIGYFDANNGLFLSI